MTHAYPVPSRRLGSTSVEVSALGFGAAALGNLYRAISDDEARAALTAALDGGIRYVDTAPHYGQGLSERRVGAFLAERRVGAVLAERRTGATLQPDTVISTKVGRVLNPIAPPAPGTERHGFIDGDPFEPEFDYSYDGVMRSFEDSLRRLDRSEVDILLAHDLGAVTHGEDAPRHMRAFLDGGYRAMRALKDQGVVAAVGLGVNEWQVCEAVLAHCDLDTVLLAGRYTLLEQTALHSFLPLCEARGVSVIIGGPFNSGVLADGDHYDYGRVPEAVRARVRALKAVCADHGVSLAAAALQFPLAHPAVACVIPGMADAAQVRTNTALYVSAIAPGLWDDLKARGLLDAAAPTPDTPARGAS